MFMETYQRRRSRKPKEANVMEMDQCSKLQDQTSKNGVQTSTPLPMSDHCPFQLDGANPDHRVSCVDFLFDNIEVEVGSVYEIDHIHLPPRTPVQLRSIRVAMVTEKTELNVAVRFPSMISLKIYFSNSIREMHPALDEKFVMGTALAAKVLLRQVPSQEFAENKHLKGFWLVNAAAVDVSEGDNSSRMDNCLTELKGTGMVRWGIRRQVKYLERHKENINGNAQSSSIFIEGISRRQIAAFGEPEEEEGGGGGDEEDDEKDEEEGEDDEDDERGEDKEGADIANEETEAEEKTQEMNRNLKRKRYKLRNNTIRQKAKKVKHEIKNKQKKSDGRGRNKCRDLLVMENPKDRWSSERYQLAAKNLLEVMKAKAARAGNPIIRPDLRAEARKRIGDTGLLDHLLKHMAGKLAPGGEVRFQRRHNADGAIEYWLESADLVNIRTEAGVNDPYWIPPPGWKPGDCPTQDPICAKELRLLKEEYFDLQRNVLELVPRKQLEEKLGKLRREIEKLKQEENQAIQVSSNHCGSTKNVDHLANLLVSSKSDLAKAPVPLEKYKEHLMVIQEFVKGIEEEIKRLMAESEGEARYDSALIVSTESGAGKEIVELDQGTKEQDVQEIINVGEEGSAKGEKTSTAAEATAEKKAAKIERLKSGFSICNPQGTFLWPNMAGSNTCTTSNMVSPRPQVVLQVEDLSVVPTPPSVSSSSALASPQLPYHPPNTTTSTNTYNLPASPVKPLAERRAITVTVSTLSNEHCNHSYSTTSTTPTTASKKPNLINLNDIPCNPVVEGFSGKSSSSKHTVATTTVMPPSLPGEAKRESSRPWEVMTGGVGTGITGAREATGHVQKQLSKCCSSSASCLSPEEEMGNWLALATAKSASEESRQGCTVLDDPKFPFI